MGVQESINSEINNNESQEYFDLIHQMIKNQTNNQFNEKKLTNEPTKNWKQEILTFLKEQYEIGIEWAKELSTLIEKNPFNSEEKYVDFFFWQKFELKTKPRCLNANNSMSTTINRDQKHLDVSLSEYQLNKEKVQEYIKVLQNHLESPDHPTTICIKYFNDIFCREIDFHIGEILSITDQDEQEERAKTVAEAITQQLVFFLFKLQDCFAMMYSKYLSIKIYEQEKEEFTTMFTSLFFSNKRLYDLIIKLFSLSNQKEIEQLDHHIKKLNEYGIKPIDVGINEKFRLDQSTEKSQLNFLFKDDVDISDEKLIYLNTYHKKKGYVPYSSSIELLKNIVSYQTPFEKISLLASMSTDVIDNVMRAWKPLEEFLPKNYLSIDGDELILIFSFIAIKADFPELLTHLYFIKMFTTQDTKSSMIGYYYTTIEASIITIRNLDEETIQKNNEKKLQIGFFDSKKQNKPQNKTNDDKINPEKDEIHAEKEKTQEKEEGKTNEKIEKEDEKIEEKTKEIENENAKEEEKTEEIDNEKKEEEKEDKTETENKAEEEKTEEKIEDEKEEKIEDKAEEKTEDKIEEKTEEKEEDKEEEKEEEKAEEKTEDKIEDKIEEKTEDKIVDKIEDKKTEEKEEEKEEEKTEDEKEEKIEDKAEEKTEDKIEDKIEEKTEEKEEYKEEDKIEEK